MKRFLQSRGVRKFRRNKLAMAALSVISIYMGVTMAILGFDLFTLSETSERVGPNTTPGFFQLSSPEKRLQDCEFYIDLVDSAMNRSNPEAAIRESPLAELTIASMPMEEREEKLDETWALYEEIADTENVDERPDLLPEIEKLETMTAALYRQPEGLAGKVYQFRRCLGTDRQGRSIMVRAVYSIKVAILIGLVTSLISVIFGSILGASAAFFGGWVDHIVIWLYSTFSSIPNLVLLTVLVYMFTGSTFDGTLIPVYAAFCMTFWIGPCRLIRGEVLKIRELEYVQAATALGFNRFYILLKHILPNTAHLMFINFSLLFIGAIKSEVILSFLGLGVKKGPSWGIMINQAGQEVINGFFWQIGAATVFMFVLVLCFNILTDALQDAFDPKHV
ncbi:MAG TPA: ABC transporter permease [Verrucomicrobiales bacterium]|nr:ABC transporter permease [Verrucomicrobiales bacterium]